MDIQKVLADFSSDLSSTFSIELHVDTDLNVKEFELFFQDSIQILQKQDDFFVKKDRTVFGTNLSSLFLQSSEQSKEAIWKHLQICCLASFLQGDFKSKLSTLLKKFFPESDAITSILDNENSDSHFKSIYEFVMNTRIASICMKIAEEFDLSELQIDNPADLLDILKNPEHPLLKKLMQKLKVKFESVNQQECMQEIEAIKAKITSLFGNVFNDMLGGTKSSVSSSVLLGNSPEARRQRMIARLQKKVHEKTSR